jgi:hypothetical protein
MHEGKRRARARRSDTHTARPSKRS